MLCSNFHIHQNLLKDKSAKWYCGRHTLICKKVPIKQT